VLQPLDNLYIENKEKIEISSNAGASFIWSDDSNYLAYSEWTKEKKQIVRILKLDGMVDRFINQEMRDL
jgi:hypothetical protein